jgi:HAE1 family hydrophobic/amphiphilic exporter-1
VLSRFFIDRPIFANVIAIITMIMGGVAVFGLPIEQYPEITPPTVQVRAMYPGANAQVVAATVAAPIEQQVNGVEDMLYMSSNSSSNGAYELTITFEIGADLDKAQVLVQNRVAVAEPILPEEVRRQGVVVEKRSTNIVIVASLTSPDNRYDSLFLSNYAALRMQDELSRVPGVGGVTIFGGNNYSMRVWLNPEKLKARNLTVQDVQEAIREQNVQVAAGQVGQQPAPDALDFQYIVTTLGRLSSPEEFENIVLKASNDSRVTFLKDVARVELGAQSYDQYAQTGGKPSANLGIFQLPGANALAVAEGVREAVGKMAKSFPEGMEVNFPFDTTIFVETSIESVYHTILEAGVLVLLVIMLFLQDWRAVLVPATTVPVTIIGAFAAMYALDFSVNMLTLFGLVLAIGIVVDDAIVIVEAAAHHVERGMTARDATIRAMQQVTGPIIGITLVLMAVFLPAAFLGGITGQFYRQFALTIAATALISAINAVTLKPAQCATWLRKPPERRNWFFRGFNYVYGRIERVYIAIVRVLLRFRWPTMASFVALLALAAWWYTQVPSSLLPTDDQGYIIANVKLPDAASQSRTREVTDKINRILDETPGIATTFTIGGLSLVDGGVASNAATYFVTFDPWDERTDPSLSQDAILGHLAQEFSKIQEAVIFAFPPPAVRGMGFRSGFEMQVEDRQGVGLEEVKIAVDRMTEAAAGQTRLAKVNSSFRPGVPQLYIDVDRVKVKSLDVPLSAVFGALQTYLGSAYVNDFNKFGRTYQVRVQAEQNFRVSPRDIERLEVRNAKGQMIPLGSLLTVEQSYGPQVISRYNLFPAASVRGEPAPGASSGEAIDIMEQIAAAELPNSMGYDWTGESFQEKRIGGQAIYVSLFAVILVYFVLAAQYESWLLPAAVILVVPLGLLGSIAATSLRGMDNNIYTQIAMVLIIALASKNAILIVEFARDLRNEGRSIYDAAVEAARLRFRPILMTSFTFILGVVPLVMATGAGAGGQRALGTAVFGGMISSTVLAVFFTPVFYLLLQSLAEWWKPLKLAPAPLHAFDADGNGEVVGHEKHGEPKSLAGTH